MKRSRLQSLLALALAGLWALLPLASALHDEDHAHRFCAEHGVVEEAGSGAVAAAQADAPGIADADDAAESAHVTCGFGFLHRAQEGLSPVRSAQPHAVRCTSAPRGLRPAEGASVLPVLVRAPKSSPPAC